MLSIKSLSIVRVEEGMQREEGDRREHLTFISAALAPFRANSFCGSSARHFS
jgi:hypothetical protein